MIEQFISAVAERSKSALPAEPGDYEKDGLLWCGKCNTPKQTRIEFDGRVIMPMCLCKCKAEALKAEEEERKRKEFAERVAAMRRTAFSERMMADWTFANDDMTDQKITGIMKRYAEHFDEMRKTGEGLLLYGSVGTGKTYAACEVANALIDRGIPCLVTNFARIANTLQGIQHKQDYIDDLNSYSLLVIDVKIVINVAYFK